MYRLAAFLLVILLFASSAQAIPTFINGITIPGSLGDQFGTSVNNGRVGFFSDVYYDPNMNQWWAVSDRGPGGGTLNYDTRVQQFTLNVDPNTGTISSFNIVQTIKFTDNGVPFNGIAPNTTNVLGRSLDPEGFVILPKSGNFLVSDEYGPAVYEFNRSGQLVRTYETPANLIPRNAANVPNFANDTGNVAGRTTNRGFEGLAISPDGKFAYAILQSAMLDEGAGNGTVNRIVKFDTATGKAVAQYAYQLDTAAQGRGTSALLALNDHEFLVLERNNRGIGIGATLNPPDKRVYKIDITGATDVSNIDLDAPGAVYTKVTKASTAFITISANTLAALGNKVPEKWEGLTIGPRLADGSFIIVTGTDNDYSVTQNDSGTQFDVYLRVTDADPFASSIECPLNQVTGCFLTSNPATAASLTSDFALLPGVLQAYRVSAADLAGYIQPFAVSEPDASGLLLAGCVLLGAALKAKARDRETTAL
ncbi:MAG TPA: esterase-like activity of phytase family protein [Candidatus Binatia bacterium]